MTQLSDQNRALIEREFPAWLKDFGAGYWTMKPSSLARLLDAARQEGAPAGEVVTYQARVHEWVVACFGEEVARDGRERNHRFLEEALELVQAAGCTTSEAHQLVDYVFGRAVGEPGQEVGGVMNTLAALCNAHGLDLDGEAEKELARVWTISDRIRAKHAAKPKHSPLPGSVTAQPPRQEGSDDYADMLWRWFDKREYPFSGEERSNGLTASDFESMLDDHEAALSDRQEGSAPGIGGEVVSREEIVEALEPFAQQFDVSAWDPVNDHLRAYGSLSRSDFRRVAAVLSKLGLSQAEGGGA